MAELLAVYGTLMSGQSYDGRPDVETMMRPLGPCRIPGVLYSEGDYPWLVDVAMYSTDYPHSVTLWPNSREHIARLTAPLSDEAAHMVLAGNAERVFGV